MQLSLQNFATLVDNMAAAVQGACSSLIDLTVGSVLRAVLEASASTALWLQYLLLQVLTMTRLSTSIGADADTWVQDFGMTRLPATSATGQVVFSTFSATTQSATIPNGTTVRTSNGTQTFSVVGGPYTRPIGTPSVTATVVALTAGPDGNVAAGAANILGTAVPGIDTVSNPQAFAGGEASETDTALRARFVMFINTRSKATEQALSYAISSVQQKLDYSIQENALANGVFTPGHVHIVVDDGSGYPPQMLLNSVADAVDAVRPVGTSITVAAPTVVSVNISLLATTLAASDNEAVQNVVVTNLSTYINNLSIGQPLRFSRLAGICYDASTSITNIQDLLVNGLSLDAGGQPGSVVRVGTISTVFTAS